MKYINNNDKYKNNINIKQNISNRTKKSENKNKNDDNVKNIYFLDRNMGNNKNKIKKNESSLLILKDYIEKKIINKKPKYNTEEKLYNYYKKSDFFEQKDFYINNPIKKKYY